MKLISIGGIGPRAIQLLLICFTLAAADLEPLRQLTQDKRFFELRRELPHFAAGASETLFYCGWWPADSGAKTMPSNAPGAPGHTSGSGNCPPGTAGILRGLGAIRPVRRGRQELARK